MKRARRGASVDGARDALSQSRRAEGPADKEIDRLLRRASHGGVESHAHGACLDAETLAAWTDGSLTALQRTAAETHAADCDRCLAVLAAIAKTSPPPAAAPQRPSWLSIRWLIPLTTAAVAITAWVLVQGPPGSPVPLPASPAVDAVKPAEPAERRERDASAQARADAPQQKISPPSPARSRDQAQLRRSDQAAAKETRVLSDRIAEKPPAPVAEPRPTPPPAAAAAPPSPPATRTEAQDKRLQSAARAAAQLPGVIISPDPNMRWRVVGHSVERSTDGGDTWRAQPTGTAVDLLAAASPAATVCWIVGRSGLILLSTDGETWRRVAFSDATVDLVSVTARDGLEATVTTADGRRYKTIDAGRTWTLQQPQ